MSKRFGLWILVCFSGVFVGQLLADPLGGGMEIGTTTSQAYEGRSVLVHPASLGYQTELNGTELATSFTYGANRYATDDFSFGLGLGYLGFGTERFAGAANPGSRYRFGLGIPTTHATFWGLRYNLNRFDNGPGFDTVDSGFQWRPSPFFSFAFLANGVNQPVVGGVTSPVQMVFGGTIRPCSFVELTLDGDTRSGSDFFKKWGYQAMLNFTPAPGIQLRAGYSDTYQFQLGLQFALGHAAVYSSLQPSRSSHRFIAGFQAGATPYRSVIQPPSVFKIEIDHTLSERAGGGGGLFGSPRPTLLGLLKNLETFEKSPIDHLVIHLETFPLGMASAHEVFSALLRLRNAGKVIEVYLGNASTKEYLIASAASAIYLEPAGELRFLGLHADRYFIRGTLDKAGVQGEFLAKGEYKSAPEMFTRDESSKESREVTLDLLRKGRQIVLADLAQGRKISSDRWTKMMDTALYSPEDALQGQLVDGIKSYHAEMEGLERTRWARESLEQRSDSLSLPKRVAVIVAHGNILNQKVKLLSLGGEGQVTPDLMKKRFDRAVKDPRTKAILLRVSSPGGEILASHEIADMVQTARKKKPVVVSMGDVAASGGYYISAPAERIFADVGTLTGSIGVFVGKFSVAGLYKTLKVNKEIQSEAPYAGLFTEHRPWNAGELRLMTRRLKQYYSGFVSYVGQKRGLGGTEAEAAAKGRVWLGGDALSLKLVDEIGGYREAIQYAAKKAGLTEGTYEVWPIGDPPSLLDLFGFDSAFGGDSAAAQIDPIQHLFSHTAARELVWIHALSNNPFLYLSEVEKVE